MNKPSIETGFPALQSRLRRLLPGLMVAFTVGFAASFLGEHYGAPSLLFALLLGLSLGFIYEDERSAEGIDFCARTVLRFAIALLGFRIALTDLLVLGWQTLALILGGVILTIFFGVMIARVAGLNKRLGLLSSGAVAICGASAALAISAVLPNDKYKDRDTAFVVVGVTTLSIMVMIIYPIVSTSVGLSDTAAGVFIGATIHDVAQVVGAGYSVSETSGDVATVTKLIRVSLLLPVVLIVGLIYRKTKKEMQARPPLLPGFLVVFLIFACANSFMDLPELLSSSANAMSQYCLIAAIAAVGLKSNLKSLMALGWGPVALMSLETVWLAGLTLAGLYVLG